MYSVIANRRTKAHGETETRSPIEQVLTIHISFIYIFEIYYAQLICVSSYLCIKP